MKKAGDIAANHTADFLGDIPDGELKRSLKKLEKSWHKQSKAYDQAHGKDAKLETESTRLEAMHERIDNVIQLPLWPDTRRGIPNIALRGALFAAIQGKKRGFVKRRKLAAQEGCQISFTGEQLNQLDLDVWETALHIADQQQINLGTECHVSVYGLLKIMGKYPKSGDNQRSLNDALTRLSACEVELRQGDYVYGGSLVVEHYRDEATGRYVIVLNPKLIKLYRAGYTQIEHDDIKKLGRKNLAKWLYRYYASHEKPYPVTIDKIHELCGSSNPHKGSFTRDLKNALSSLVDIGFLRSCKIESGKVYVQKA